MSRAPAAYEGIAAEVRGRVEDGTYPPGSVLPSNRELRAEFGVADGTIRRALAELDRLGLTVARQGRQRMVAAAGQRSVGTLYERVAEGIREAIAKGHYAAGTALPSEAELAAEYGVARKTVRQALAQLERGGEVINRPGRRRQVPGGQQRPDALYEKVVARITDEIAAGRILVGASVPSEEALQAEYGVSRTMIRRALDELRRRDVIRQEGGRGRPVWGQADDGPVRRGIFQPQCAGDAPGQAR